MPFLKREIAENALRFHSASNYSANNDFACFVSNGKKLGSYLYVVSNSLEIKFVYETDCNIALCAISLSGKYVVFRTAYAPYDYNDGAMIFFVDVEKKQLLWKKEAEAPVNGITNLFIDEIKNNILEFHKDYTIIYDFNGSCLNKNEWILSRAEHSDATFYTLLGYANNFLNLSINENYDYEYEQTILYFLNGAINKGIASEYQLAQTYKLLGDYYFNLTDGTKALDAYKTGLKYYPKLPVKRVIKTLSDSLGIDENSVELLHTKWGTYVMPDPYHVSIIKGPRNDLKKMN